MRANYEEWWRGMQEDEHNSRLTRAKSRFLVGVTKPKNMKHWERLTTNILAKELKRKEREAESALAQGEVRVELTSLKLSKNGITRLGVLHPSAMAGDGLVLVKVAIPGDDVDVTEPFPMRKGVAKTPYQKRSMHEGGRTLELNEFLTSPDPEASEVILSLYLCNKNGAELMGTDEEGNTVSKGEIGTARIGLKDMLRDQKLSDNGTAEIQGILEVSGIVGLPPKEEKGVKKPKPVKRSSSALIAPSDLDSAKSPGGASVAGSESIQEEKPVPIGDIKVRIAVRPPAESAVASAAAGFSGGGGGGDPESGGTGPDGQPLDMLSLAQMYVRKAKDDGKGALPPRTDGAAQPSPDGSMAASQRRGSVAPSDLAGEAVGEAHSPGSVAYSVPLSASGMAIAGDGGGNDDVGGPEEGGEAAEKGESTSGAARAKPSMTTIAKMFTLSMKKDTLTYTFAYWIKWRPIDAIGDQLLFFGEPRNQPALIRGSKLGALVDNQFCATEYDPRLAGDNWQLLVVTNDGTYSKFYMGFPSTDDSGHPVPCRAQEPDPGRDPGEVKTEFTDEVQIRRLVTAGKGAGWLAQAWIWPRDLQPDEVRELWLETKKRYPVATKGMPKGGLGKVAYREPPKIKGLEVGKASASAAKKEEEPAKVEVASARKKGDSKEPLPWERLDPIRDKDTAAMLEVPLAAKLAFQRLLNVFAVLVDYTAYSASFLVIDRIYNMSNTPELMLELALRRNPKNPPTVLLMDSKKRLVEATLKLKQLQACGFLIDEMKRYGSKLTSHEFATGSDLRRLVTPAGLAWLRASAADLKMVEAMVEPMATQVRQIYRQHGRDADLMNDGRPKMSLIWTNFYQAQLYASATHYIIFDDVDVKGRSILSTLGQCGTIFLNGSTETYRKILDCVDEGTPLLLLESTGGVTQAFAYVMKAVRLMKPKWDVDFVMRLVTEYKARAARDKNGKLQQEVNKKYMLENIHLLDKELARIDLLLDDDTNEEWKANFGLPEVLTLFEIWQRAPDFLLRQLQTADVMKRSAESLLDLFTGCFSSGGGGIPELGLGNAETKVVATAWNRHLLLYNNARIYNYRSWIMQFVLYYFAFCTTSLSIFIANFESLSGSTFVNTIMLILPIITALLGTVGTRLRQQQKYSVCKMASYEIVSEIYKFRVRAIDYDALGLAAVLNAKNNAGKDKKKDDGMLEAPISGKEKDRLARQVFVGRVQAIYNNCMVSEMAKGTAITHVNRFGMDPARLLRGEDSGPDEGEKETRAQLQLHVANRLYFLKNNEWAYGTDAVKTESEAFNRKRREKIKRTLQRQCKAIAIGGLRMLVNVIILGIYISAALYAQVKRRLGQAVEQGKQAAQAAMKAASGDDDEEGGGAAAAPTVEERVQAVREKWLGFLKPPEVDEEEEEEDIYKGERLDETYLEEDEDAPKGAAVAAAPTGGSKRIRDDFFSSITIDDYMQYRAKPLCAYLERTAPWRGYWMQVCEIMIFAFSSSGAVLVGLGESMIPYVAMTVAAASIVKSFMEFSNLGKQVEAYNTALRDVHTMMNEWDGLTRTERRTRQTIKKVVTTVENAMALVAIALTDALPSGQADDNEGDEEAEEEK